VLQNWQNITIGVLTAALLLNIGVIVVQRQWLARARHDAAHDDLTGLPNRRTATRHLRAALRRSQPTGIVLIDLDRFKTINDTHGHDGGNQVLNEVARRLDTLTDLPVPIAMAARLSGDEYLLIVHGDRDDTAAAAHAALTAITTRPIHLDGQHIALTASAGWATASLGTTTREVLHAADTAMYQAKRDGRATQRGAATITDPEGIGRLPRPRDLRDAPTAEHPIPVRSTRLFEEYRPHG
jgi:diguanylate cyclase (GGDEF)-like protein